jgi:hypothetical protein
MNKSGALFTYYRGLIGIGAAQRLQVSNVANSETGDFIGVPAFDPTRNRLYLGNPADSNEGTFRHGLIALDAQPNCMLNLAWQRQVGLNATPSQENPVISPWWRTASSTTLRVQRARSGLSMQTRENCSGARAA